MGDFDHVFVAGHSFGGITAVFAARAMQAQQARLSAYRVRGALAFEPWFEPKADAVLSEAWRVPYLCIIGDRWRRTPVLWDTCERVMAANECEKHMAYVEGMSHNDFCDACLWAPQWLLRRIGACVANDTVQRAQDCYTKM